MDYITGQLFAATGLGINLRILDTQEVSKEEG